MTELKIPEMGESVSTGYLAVWLKQDGDSVEAGEEVLELETDKATLSIPSPATGILKILIMEGEEVEIGQTVGHLEDTAMLSGAVSGEDHYSPSVRQLLHSYGLSSFEGQGSGKKGHVTREDVLSHIKSKGLQPVQVPETESVSPAPAAVQSPPTAAPAPQSSPGASPEAFTRKKMSRIRQKIAANLVQSKQQSAHLTTFNEVDMSAVMEIRTLYKDDFLKKKGVKLGYMSFFVKAVCSALAEYPQINAIIDGEDLLFRNHLNIGIAVSTDKGLITPVLRQADGLSFVEIESQIISFARRANERKLLPDELRGGTFTITNGGIFGSLLSTPIPSPGQSGILGMHSIVKKPVVRDDEVVIRPMMFVALTYDHRIVDGREAVGFLNIVKNSIEDPRRMLIDF
ncbi:MULTISPECIES: dihydrolipoyllysine-residue succinyltransferase [unclassified Oceanispirochaeta]|uniref:dihydrolipoyllysine-residue succinyltransferase n=1 Tax=unclassified Oceanispirochaeta TaxID=2635722 RepID=UPI000E097947|nr:MULTISPECIES: dihydrolipoyllysine-residue succinyltransferase [unclassified Oceanispirochaeta]MBF9017491.1 dihydrolipoyllysine-residue succinyltransferase [Oceanispirochaeta sp. M2]NPD74063.1 dihydrolipoyllysine-residue succinyltransferase [Oceanispirochaeta sp. M1]RDG30105.1 dihydrolipoyllysine-residue succinyltransferase [Oceanispirochaeta sp. M1]